MKLGDLKPNAKNPRKISETKLKALRKSVDKFGDLSGFVYNRRTKTLVSGHQKQKGNENATIKIEKKYETPTKSFTVAEGYVEIGSERFKYREVDADPSWEVEALLAANGHGGEWDADLLRLNISEFPSLDLEATGFDMPQLERMNIRMPRLEMTKQHEPQPVPWDSDEGSTYDWADSEENGSNSKSDEDDDAAYMRENPGPDSEVRQESIDTVNRGDAFAAVEENTVAQGRRIIIIIDCPTDEVKAELKEKLRPIVEPTGAKYF